VMEWFDIVAARVVHVGQDSCTRTLPVAFQSLQHTRRASESERSGPFSVVAKVKDRFRSGELAAVPSRETCQIDTNELYLTAMSKRSRVSDRI